MLLRMIIFSILLTAFISCGKTPQSIPVQNQNVGEPLKTATCTAKPEADPGTIDQLIQHINSLPKPLDLPCFLQSLKRPLFVNATSSTMSAQPANGIKSPRIFIFKDKLVISIVPDGEGSGLLEYSEFTSPSRSIKGEIALPVHMSMTVAESFSRITNSGRTTCSGCHNSEQKEYSVDGVNVYSSQAFRPAPSKNVNLDTLKNEKYICDSNNSTSNRCKVLKALFSHGEVRTEDFSSTLPTFLSSF